LTRGSKTFDHATCELAAEVEDLDSDYITEVCLINNASYLD